MQTESAHQGVLVTGGSGFVGAHVVRAFGVRGFDVTSLSTNEPDESVRSYWDDISVRVAVGDIRDLAFVRRVTSESRAKIVVHAAAITDSPAQPSADALRVIDTNVCGSMAVLLSARELRASRVVLVGSASVYQVPSDDDAVLEESAPLRTSGWYALSKTFQEVIGRQFAAAGLDVRVARVAAAFGPLERPSNIRPRTSLPYRLIQARLAGDCVDLQTPDRRLDFTYVKDIAEGIVALSLARSLGHYEYNVAAGEAVKFSEMESAVARYFDRPSIVDAGATVRIEADPSERRGRLSIARLRRDASFVTSYSLDRAMRDYAGWMRGVSQ